MSRSVVLITNSNKPRAMAAVDRVRSLIAEHGQLVAELESFEEQSLPDPHHVDLVIALGGDGTILSAARRCIALRAPLLGVNTGKVGFMAGFELESFESNAKSLLGDGDFHIHRVTPMHGTVTNKEGTLLHDAFAINDFVVSAGPPFRMITLGISVDSQPGPTVSGDGMIVSSPLGSTAYNVSAGGPIVSPGVNAMVVTPIAAHSLSFRPIVIPSSSSLRIELSSVNATQDSGTTLIIDGQVSHQLNSGDVLQVTSAKDQIHFVLDPQVSYWQTLLGKMHWASEPKADGLHRE